MRLAAQNWTRHSDFAAFLCWYNSQRIWSTLAKRLPSSNHRWQWKTMKIADSHMIFLLRPPFTGDFPYICLPEGIVSWSIYIIKHPSPWEIFHEDLTHSKRNADLEPIASQRPSLRGFWGFFCASGIILDWKGRQNMRQTLHRDDLSVCVFGVSESLHVEHTQHILKVYFTLQEYIQSLSLSPSPPPGVQHLAEGEHFLYMHVLYV